MPSNQEIYERFERSLTNHRPSDSGLEAIGRLRLHAKYLARSILDETEQSREQSIALTHLEEATMWAVKAIALQTGEPTVP